MKEFNLEEAKAGKPVCTRDGKDVRIVCYDAKCETCNGIAPIIALIKFDAKDMCFAYSASGRFINYNVPHDYDLMMKEEKHEKEVVL